MPDLAHRFETNPILRPSDVAPSRDGMKIECLLNPGVFRYDGKTWLLIRVAERPEQPEGKISTPILDPLEPTGIKILEIALDDPALITGDPRGFTYNGESYLTTLSHLRLAHSEDGIHFTPDARPSIMGAGELETFGIEDCRVVEIDGVFHLTYTAVSRNGIAVGLIDTSDWKTFHRQGLIFPPSNKDCAIFPEKIGGLYYALHRPSNVYIGGPYIWLAHSPDLRNWGGHQCIARTRPGTWDEQRVGAGAAPIRTERGWLEIYHGADANSRYCLGALLLDSDNPVRVLARSKEPIMEPIAEYEKTGFFGNVVFTNGHVVDGDTLTIYYGASDEVICGARFSIAEILSTLKTE
jgi:predicted GH43/DUF377 family glycosyl hydrolase